MKDIFLLVDGNSLMHRAFHALPVMDAHGMAHYDMSPEAFASAMKRLVAAGATVVGGCCGTTPDYIRALKQAVAAPR